MNLAELESKIRILKLKMLSNEIQNKKSSRNLKNQYLHMSLLLLQTLIKGNKINKAEEIIVELLMKYPSKINESISPKKSVKRTKRAFLEPNDGLGKLLPGVE